MENYSIYLAKESEKYAFLGIIRDTGARLEAVSGCGDGYNISIKATPSQADKINTAWAGVTV